MSSPSSPVARPAILFSGLLAVLAALYSYRASFLGTVWPLSSYLSSFDATSSYSPWLRFILGSSHDAAQTTSKLGQYECPMHNYTTEIVSIDPLLIYINNFITPQETDGLLELGNSSFAPSRVYLQGRNQGANSRTSESAGLPRTHPVTACILARARSFMGGMFARSDDFSMPQLVRYGAGQKFDLHHDWYSTPQWSDFDQPDGTTIEKKWNRMASFFVFVRGRCMGGETYFPRVRGMGLLGERNSTDKAEMKMRVHEEGGMAFKPVEGNAIFWVNLMPNGDGDKRVMHAGLPLESGLKVGMNLWPRKIYPS